MNMKQRIAVVLFLAISLIVSGCAPGQIFGPTVTPTPLPTLTPTATPIPTQTPTPLPPTATEVPPTATFPATVMVNGVDVLSALLKNGFTYTGGEELGGCTASCAVYDDTNLGLSTYVYADASPIIFMLDLNNVSDISAAVKTQTSVIEKIYGHDMVVWIADKSKAAIKGGTAQDGRVGKFEISMELDNDGTLILITISPAS